MPFSKTIAALQMASEVNFTAVTAVKIMYFSYFSFIFYLKQINTALWFLWADWTRTAQDPPARKKKLILLG